MKKLYRLLVCPVLIVALVAATACAGTGLKAYRTLGYFNSQICWAFCPQSEQADAAVWNELTALAEQIEAGVSLSQDSDIAAFNRAGAGERVEISALTYRLLAIADDCYWLTDGAYNPAAGILVDLWGFSPRCNRYDYSPELPYDRADYTSELPDGDYIRAFLPLTDFSAVACFEENGSYYVQKPDLSVEKDGVIYTVQLNLGGLAKGYFIDCAEEIVRRAGYTEGYVNLGSSGLAVFRDPSEKDGVWKVGVNPPRSDLSEGFLSLNIMDTTVSTSGDYELFYECGGKRCCHIIDPFTGYPVNASPQADGSGIITASVCGVSGAVGDALTTAIMVMGPERAKTFVKEKLADYGAVFVCVGSDNRYTVCTTLDDASFQTDGSVSVVKL